MPEGKNKSDVMPSYTISVYGINEQKKADALMEGIRQSLENAEGVKMNHSHVTHGLKYHEEFVKDPIGNLFVASHIPNVSSKPIMENTFFFHFSKVPL